MSATEIPLEDLISGDQATAPESPDQSQSLPVDETPEVQSVAPVEALPTPDTPLDSDEPVEVTASSDRLIHFLNDGLTCLGNVWLAGQELVIDDAVYEYSKDRHGKSFLDLTESEQVVQYGRVHFRDGPAPQAIPEAQIHAQNLADQARRPPVIPISI